MQGLVMNIEDALQEFQGYVAEKAKAIATLPPEQTTTAMLGFYRDVRASDCDLDSDGDMLLVQWGTYDWGKGEWFEFDITRQFIPTGEDPEIMQLSVKFTVAPDDELRGIASGSRWCHSLKELPDFWEFVKALRAYGAACSHFDAKLEVSYFQA
jgi:hypothetical protein